MVSEKIIPEKQQKENSKKEKEKEFVDISASGKKRPWREKKLESLTYAEMLALLQIKKAKKVYGCVDYLEIVRPPDGGSCRVYRAFFCKSRLCPLCAWRKALHDAHEADEIVQEVQKSHPSARWLFLTFTEKNTDEKKDLDKALKEINSAWRRIYKRKVFQDLALGGLKSLEITTKIKKGRPSYHQHLHVLLCVKSTYFARGYLPQKAWRDLWREARKLDYDPSVRVKAIKKSEEKKAVREVAKYSVKSGDYIDSTFSDGKKLEVLDVLEEILHHKRLFDYFGELKKAQKTAKKEKELEEPPEEVEIAYVRWDHVQKKYFESTEKKVSHPRAEKMAQKNAEKIAREHDWQEARKKIRER